MESADIKTIISNHIESLVERISRPENGRNREFPLIVDNYRYYADFAYRIDKNAWLFVEDDEGQTSTGNASKYWQWIERNGIKEPVHLIHIIGPSYGNHKLLSSFLCKKATEQFPQFVYYQIVTTSWDSQDWVEGFKNAASKIVGG